MKYLRRKTLSKSSARNIYVKRPYLQHWYYWCRMSKELLLCPHIWSLTQGWVCLQCWAHHIMILVPMILNIRQVKLHMYRYTFECSASKMLFIFFSSLMILKNKILSVVLVLYCWLWCLPELPFVLFCQPACPEPTAGWLRPSPPVPAWMTLLWQPQIMGWLTMPQSLAVSLWAKTSSQHLLIQSHHLLITVGVQAHRVLTAGKDVTVCLHDCLKLVHLY